MNKVIIQADQGSKMNLVNTTFARDYHLIMHFLSKIGFFSLIMRYVNNREILMHHFVNLKVGVKGI
jgi:hypothetical protein